MSGLLRGRFAEAHHDVLLLDAKDRLSIEGYLVARNLVARSELPARIERAGPGSMNLTLRVTLRTRSFIVKQGRPWIEEDDHLAAPWERTLVEGQFYETVRSTHAVSSRMPELLMLDRHNHVLVLEDAGRGGDFTSMYADRRIGEAELGELLDWLSALGRIAVPESSRSGFANRATRALNHAHSFTIPLEEDNGVDLDRVTRGLASAADELKRDRTYRWHVRELGFVYLADGTLLVHGDYAPGSWLRSARGIRVIDPELCFVGAREFDYGVMLAHLALARVHRQAAALIVAAAGRGQLDNALVLGFAGVEIMRRLIGAVPLAVPYGVVTKRHLLDLSRTLILAPERGLTCW